MVEDAGPPDAGPVVQSDDLPTPDGDESRATQWLAELPPGAARRTQALRPVTCFSCSVRSISSDS